MPFPQTPRQGKCLDRVKTAEVDRKALKSLKTKRKGEMKVKICKNCVHNKKPKSRRSGFCLSLNLGFVEQKKDGCVAFHPRREVSRAIKAGVVTTIESCLDELVRAEIEHPKWPKDMIHQAAILSEEAGEFVQAVNDHVWKGADAKKIQREAIQVGAMVLRFLKNFKAVRNA